MTPKIDQATADKIRKLYRDGIPNKILAWRFRPGQINHFDDRQRQDLVTL